VAQVPSPLRILFAYAAGAYIALVALTYSVFGPPRLVGGYFNIWYAAVGMVIGFVAASLSHVISRLALHAIMLTTMTVLGVCFWFLLIAMVGI